MLTARGGNSVVVIDPVKELFQLPAWQSFFAGPYVVSRRIHQDSVEREASVLPEVEDCIAACWKLWEIGFIGHHEILIAGRIVFADPEVLRRRLWRWLVTSAGVS